MVIRLVPKLVNARLRAKNIDVKKEILAIHALPGEIKYVKSMRERSAGYMPSVNRVV